MRCTCSSIIIPIVPLLALTITASLSFVGAFGIFAQRSRGVSFSHTTSSRTFSFCPGDLSRRPALEVWIEDAEDGFVDNDENLEQGEVLVKAVKAFASDPDDPALKRFLSAGALVQRPSEPLGEQRLDVVQPVIYDAWMADAIMDGGIGGPNLQLRGAVQILDDLFRCFLSMDSSSLSDRTFVVQCGSGDTEYTCASYHAAIARGFRSVDDIEWPDSDLDAPYDEFGICEGLIFDASLGVSRYTAAALDCWEMATRTVALEILSFLSAQRNQFRFSGNDVGRHTPPVRYFGQITHRPGLLPQDVVQEIVERVQGAERAGLLSDESDSVDFMPSLHLSLITSGRRSTEPIGYSDSSDFHRAFEIVELVEPFIEGDLLPRVKSMVNSSNVVVSEIFIRRYGRDIQISPDSCCSSKDGTSGKESRLSIPAHYDVSSAATAVIALDNVASGGRSGLYTITGGGEMSHTALRRYFPLKKGDVVLHSCDVIHGVDVEEDRTSLVVWFAKQSTKAALPTRLETQSDSVSDFILGSSLEASTVDFCTGDHGGLDDLPLHPFDLYIKSASAGNSHALTRLGSLFEMGLLSSFHASCAHSLLEELQPQHAHIITSLDENDENSVRQSLQSSILSQRFYLEAAVRGNSLAQAALADTLMEHCHEPHENDTRLLASVLYALAAQQGDEGAEQSLMSMITEEISLSTNDCHGEGVPRAALVGRAAFAAKSEELKQIETLIGSLRAPIMPNGG